MKVTLAQVIISVLFLLGVDSEADVDEKDHQGRVQSVTSVDLADKCFDDFLFEVVVPVDTGMSDAATYDLAADGKAFNCRMEFESSRNQMNSDVVLVFVFELEIFSNNGQQSNTVACTEGTSFLLITSSLTGLCGLGPLAKKLLLSFQYPDDDKTKTVNLCETMSKEGSIGRYRSHFTNHNVNLLLKTKSLIGSIRITATSARDKTVTELCERDYAVRCEIEDSELCMHAALKCDDRLNCGVPGMYDEDDVICKKNAEFSGILLKVAVYGVILGIVLIAFIAYIIKICTTSKANYFILSEEQDNKLFIASIMRRPDAKQKKMESFHSSMVDLNVISKMNVKPSSRTLNTTTTVTSLEAPVTETDEEVELRVHEYEKIKSADGGDDARPKRSKKDSVKFKDHE